MSVKRSSSVLALAATITALVAGCAGAGAPGGLDDVQTVTWWHNSTTGAGHDYYEQVAIDFEKANPGVNVEITALDHEDMRARLAATLGSDDPEQVPDVFMSRGGGELRNEVANGVTRDLTTVGADVLADIDQFTDAYKVDDKVYALPYSMGVVGFFYHKDLFAQAGITEVDPNPTIDEFNGWVAALKAAGITPISVGAGDGWPAAHYWFYNVIRECSDATVDTAIEEMDFSATCFLAAGERLEDLLALEPFNENFYNTGAQEGPTSASGLLAHSQVAMELAGHWEPGVLTGLREDGSVPSDLSWFAYPTFPGQAGAADAQMGGGDAWEVSTSAPDAAVDLALYLLSDEVQNGFAARDMGLPTNSAARDAVVAPALRDLITVRDSASTAPRLYLDTRLGDQISGPLLDEVKQLFMGQSSAQGIIDTINESARANG